MIEFAQGNLLDSKVDAQVNTVNVVGVMGAGIALQFKNKYPNCFKLYQQACHRKELQVGSIFVYHTDLDIPKYILNFPTKEHWKNDSKIEYIVDGLIALLDTIRLYGIKSVAVPALGCQNGGLIWEEVKPLMVTAFETMPDVNFTVYYPQKYFSNVWKNK